MSLRRTRKNGFALVETIIAFMILAIGLTVVGSSMAVAVRGDAHLDARRSAEQLARSRMEAAGVSSPLLAGVRSGIGSGNVRWSEKVTPVRVAIMPVSKDGGAQDTSDLLLYWVEEIIESSDGGLVRLASLKCSTRGRHD